MNKKNLITQQSTELTLRKATDIINRTNKILKNSKKELVANPDIMIIDGKMWQKETVAEKMTWDEAMEYAKNLRLGGYDDWRLPTLKEFREVICSCGGIDQPNSNESYWSSTIDKNISNKFYQSSYKSKGFNSDSFWSSSVNCRDASWVVNFSDGYSFVDDNNHKFLVRCLRYKSNLMENKSKKY